MELINNQADFLAIGLQVDCCNLFVSHAITSGSFVDVAINQPKLEDEDRGVEE